MKKSRFMTKGIILSAIGAIVILGACKKTSTTNYYYELFEIGVRYPATGSPSDSASYIDSAQHFYTTYQGDTVDYGSDASFVRAGSYYLKRYQHFEVYRYTK